MTRHVTILFVLVFTSLFSVATAQPAPGDSDPTMEILPPSPSAAALTKFVDFPVSYHTGTPQINIPIHTISGKGISVPVSLSYHAGGVKVDEVASQVGLGWSLNAGGVISRTVRGFQDEKLDGFIDRGADIPYPEDVIPNIEDLRNFADGDWDGQPDLFNFNFGGYSGKFIYKDDGSIMQIPFQDLEIVPNICSSCPSPFFSSTIISITITTPDGIEYLFGTETAIESSETTGTGLSGECRVKDFSTPAVTAWYLKEINNPRTKDKITFNYLPKTIQYDLAYTESFTYPPTPHFGDCATTYSHSSAFCTTFKTDDGVILESIDAINGKIVFVNDNQRSDLFTQSGNSRLREIQIYGKQNGLLKKYKLVQNTIQSSGATPSAEPSSTFRMYLDEVEEYTAAGIFSNEYQFEYHNRDQLPPRLSFQQDHWGYFNGKNNQQMTPAPDPTTATLNYIQSFFTNFTPADRSPDQSKAQYGNIKKVTYPTGGFVEYEFEGNEVPVCDEVESYGNAITNNYITYTNGAETVTTDFTIDQSQLVEVTYDIIKHGFRDFGALVKILDSNDQEVEKWGGHNAPLEDSIIQGTEYIYLTAGDYTLLSSVFEPNEQADIGIVYMVLTTETIDNDPTGGIRLRQLTIDDGDTETGNNIVRSFKYEKNVGGCNQSSAHYLGRAPYYISNDVKIVSDPEVQCAYEECHFTRLTSSSLTNLTNYAGNIVGYREVWEWQGLNAENGKKYFKYETFSDLNPQLGPNGYNIFVSTPTVDYSFKSGMLVEEHIYNANNDPLFEKSYVYEFNETTNEDSQKALVTRKVFEHPCENNLEGEHVLIPYAIEWYDVVTQWIHLDKETIKQYADDGSGNYVETVTDYEYDLVGGQHTMPLATIMTNSDNKVHRTEMKYVFDMPTDPIWDDMDDRNMISTPIETKILVDGTPVDGVKNVFSYFNSSGLPTTTAGNDPPLLHEVQRYEVTWNAGGTLVDDGWVLLGTVDEYESDGLIRQYTKDGWLPEAYEWVDGLLTKKTYDDFEWEYTYYENSKLISTMTDIDGQLDSFKYDGLQRLSQIIDRDGAVNTYFTYQYKDVNNPHNFVKQEVVFDATPGSELTNRITIQYMDGLGRPIQNVEKGYSPNEKDVITVTEFDAFGRPFQSFEPFEGAGALGEFVPESSWPAQMYATVTGFEPSPLNRADAVTPPEWYTSFTEYGVNTSPVNIPGTSISYPAGALLTSVTIEPDGTATKTGDRTVTFTDKKGRTILSRRENQTGSEQADTYYLYDDKDRVIKVIPPDAAATDAGLVYTYTYTTEDLISTKKIPDQAEIQYLYNDRDLVTYTQDGNMLSEGKWLHTQYDQYGRPTATGFVDQNPTGGDQVLSFDEALTTTCYDGCEFTGTPPQIYVGKVHHAETRILGTNDWLETLHFYDAYGRLEKTESNNHLNLADPAGEVIEFEYDLADNLITSLRTHKVGTTTTTILEENTYDHSGRLENTFHQVNGGAKVQTSQLAYTIKDEMQTRRLGKDGSSWLQKIDFTYQENGFLESINQPALGSTTAELDLCESAFPGSSVSGENDLFYLQLNYEQVMFGITASPQYNGNIAQLIWRVRGREQQTYGFDYDFLNRLEVANYYDINETGAPRNQTNKFDVEITYEDDRGNMESIKRRGLYWDGSCWIEDQIDDLAFSYYNGTNRLQDVNDVAIGMAGAQGFSPYTIGDSGADYLYDANGNVKSDPSKALGITYNYLNLPETVSENGGNGAVSWLYDAGGMKLRKSANTVSSMLHLSGSISSDTYQAEEITADGTVPTGSQVIFEAGTEIELQAGFETQISSDFEAEVTGVTGGEVRDYVNGIEYRNGVIEAIYHANGRVYFDNGIPRYEYTITDHLGNARLSFADLNENGTIEVTTDPATNELLQENHYYPFGMGMEGPWKGHPDRENPYQYNGKELNEDLGLNWLDYGTRWYDPSVGRWNAVDPLAEKMMSWSPYNYTFNNPIRFIDSDGEFPIISGVAGFFKGLFRNKKSFEGNAKTRLGSALKSAARYEKQAWKIIGGLGTTDKNKSFGGKILQLLSRFTWELPNTAAGFITSEITNTFSNVNWVDYEGGATVLNTDYYFGAFTLGSFIIGDRDIKADFKDDIFRHEYGHYLQSQSFGPGYLPGFGIPSFVRATLLNFKIVGGNYDDFYTEGNATRRGDRYFIKRDIREMKTDPLPANTDAAPTCLGCYNQIPSWLKLPEGGVIKNR